MVHIVFCVNDIYNVSSLNQSKNIETFQSVHNFSFILCYTVLWIFLALVFSLIRVRKLIWEDITQGKQ